MKAKHQKTLQLIFQRPVSGSVRWADIEALFAALGADLVGKVEKKFEKSMIDME